VTPAAAEPAGKNLAAEASPRRGDDLRQEQGADYRYFDLRGSHFAIGYEMGRASPMRAVRTWRDRRTELLFAEACVRQVARFHPALPEEVWGFAAGQDRGRNEVLSHFSLNLPEGRLSACTTLAARLPDGHMLIARNYDFVYSQRQRYLRRVAPGGYPASLGTQAGLIGSCYDGVSSKGLFVALHLIHAQIAPDVPPGIPYHLIPRVLLETCDTARMAVDQLLRIPHMFPFNYLVADRAGAYAVEAYPGRVRVRGLEHNRLVVTNYFAHADMRPLQGRRKLGSQRLRVRWLEQEVDLNLPSSAREAWPWARAVLSDHDAPMCHHRPTQATLWATIVDLTARRIAYCLGAPCRNEFAIYEWPSAGRAEA
jgi:predicted choloylglycine hydrolase